MNWESELGQGLSVLYNLTLASSPQENIVQLFSQFTVLMY